MTEPQLQEIARRLAELHTAVATERTARQAAEAHAADLQARLLGMQAQMAAGVPAGGQANMGVPQQMAPPTGLVGTRQLGKLGKFEGPEPPWGKPGFLHSQARENDYVCSLFSNDAAQ